ncbi:MAG: Glu-tRNA(Gln) amidotransferase subunit GatD [Nanoarchaeota archaeon]|nr:Glu-tRNA(Gln) amidotransferase subunit GatD [Nanoarchaeota archaeon]
MVELNFNPGDYVKLRLAKREVEGTILESTDSSVYLLKLKTGYNVGIPKENVLAGRALKKYSEEKPKLELKEKKGLKSIGLIVTGGTIASKADPKTGAVHPLTDVGEFAKFYPELFEMVNVKKIEVPFMIFSEAMTSEHWIKIAETAGKMLNDKEIEGVIVTHGTDFLHYTSAALSFFLRNLNKPVVLTYSQRSIDRGSSDANLNLQCAAQMALSDCAEVMLVGHGTTNDDFCYAMPGTKVRKMHSSRRDAFKVVNGSPIAKVWPDKVEFLGEHKPRNKNKVELDAEFSDKVALVKFYPGQDPDILDYYALKYKGLVVEGAGLGHVSEAWFGKLKKHIREGMVVCMATQTVFGRVDSYVYSTGRQLLDAGVVYLEDMLPETALVKLGWVLGHHGWKGRAAAKMLENVAGELNERLQCCIIRK